MTVTYRVGAGGAGTVDLGDVVFLGDVPGFTSRADGSLGTSGIEIQDEAGALDLVGLNKFAVEEDACAEPRIFTGVSADRGIDRGEYSIGAGRVWDMSVLDQNAFLHLRVIRDGNHGNRPAETDVERVAWLLDEVLDHGHVINGTGGTYGAKGPTAGVLGAPRNVDAADYRGQHADDVLGDIGPPGNRRFFTYWDSTLEAVCLFYGLNNEHLADSTLRISNVAADANSTTFAPMMDAKLTRDPQDVAGGILFKYRKGYLYREDPDTIAAFLDRSILVTNERVGSPTTASTFVDRLLDKASAERDSITVTVNIPKDKVNLVVEGMRIQVKFSHLPGFESFRWIHVLSRTVLQEVATTEFYSVRLELCDYVGGLGTGGSGGGGPFVPGSDPITFVRKQHAYGASNPWTFTPSVAPAAGNLLVITAHTRAATDKLLAIPGWTIVESALASGGGAAGTGMSMFYRTAVAGDTAWSIAAAQCELSYSEYTGAVALVDSASQTVDPPETVPYDLACGGSVTPGAVPAVLLIGGASMGLDNDTDTLSVVPDTGIIELDDWNTTPSFNGNPGRWSGYRIVSAPSGSYVVSGDATVGATKNAYAGITAAFTAGASNTPTHGQGVTETATGQAAGATFTTNYGYYPNSLDVHVGGVAIIPDQTDPTAGEFTLPIDTTGLQVLITYQAADGVPTGAGNAEVPASTPPVIPSSVLPPDQWKQPVRVATTTSGTLASAFENGDSVDGVALATGDRILLKDQATGSQNGIYVVAASGAPVRAIDFDGSTEVVGALVYVVAGVANGGRVFRNTNTTAPTIGTTALTFVEFTPGAGAINLDDLGDVVITTPVVADRVRYDGSVWRNSPLIWKPVMDGLGNVVTDSGTGEAIVTEVVP